MGSIVFAVIPINFLKLLFFAPLFSLHRREKSGKTKRSISLCPHVYGHVEAVLPLLREAMSLRRREKERDRYLKRARELMFAGEAYGVWPLGEAAEALLGKRIMASRNPNYKN